MVAERLELERPRRSAHARHGSTALGLQVLARRNLLALGGARYLRLVYRISGAVPTGAISATLETAPKDRFGYGSSEYVGGVRFNSRTASYLA